MVQIGRSRYSQSVKMHRTCYLFFFTLLAVLYSTLADHHHHHHHHQSPRGSEYDDDYDDDLDDYLYDDYGEKKPSSGGGGGAGGAPAETSAFNFVRLLVLRLVWGFASMFGVQEGLEDFMGGIFVPPGVESDDDFDLGF